MNISQHSFVPTCQYALGNFTQTLSVNAGTTINSSIKRRSLYPESFDNRYSYFDFPGVNSLLFLSIVAVSVRPFIGFPNKTYPFGNGVYLPYSEFGAEGNLHINYTYNAASGANLERCKTMYISDDASDAQVRYIFWNEPVKQLLGMRRSNINYVDEEEII